MKIKINKKTMAIGILAIIFGMVFAKAAIPDAVTFKIENSTGTVFTVDKVGHLNATGNIQAGWDLYVEGTIHAGADKLAESIIDFDTSCGTGNHLYVNGNNLACEADDDTPDSDAEVPDAITVDGGVINLTTNVFGGTLGGDNITDGTIDESELADDSVKVGELDVSDVSDDIAADIAEGELADSIILSTDIKDGVINASDLVADLDLHYNNLTACTGTEILKMSGGAWVCAEDVSGAVDSYVNTTGDTMTGNLTMQNPNTAIVTNDTHSYIYFDSAGAVIVRLEA